MSLLSIGRCRPREKRAGKATSNKSQNHTVQAIHLAMFLAACALILSACTGMTPSPMPTSTPLPTPTVTPTIIWFPPTSTKTPYPSPMPFSTQEYLPGVGEILFNESFDNLELWDTVVSPSAIVILADNQLTLSVASDNPATLLLSLRKEPLLENFYLEVTAHLNLCRGDDRYGLVFRAGSSGSYYRYVLNCKGQTRFERVAGGQASAPRDWLTSPLAPAGAPGEVRIGIWAVKSEMRFFLNDRYQYSIDDNTYRSGTIGLFVSTNTSTPTSVSFSDMVVYAVTYKRPTPTRIPSATP